MGLTVSTRFFFDRKNVIDKVKKGRRKALSKAGAITFRSVRREFVSGKKLKRGSVRQIGMHKGLPLMELRKRKSNKTRISSYKSARNPKGFLKASVRFAYDPARDSVVVGPASRAAWLNVLHERGGTRTQTLYLRAGGRPVDKQKAYNLRKTGNRSESSRKKVYVGTFFNPAPQSPGFVKTSRKRTVNVRASMYQRQGLRKVLSKLPEQFRGQIHGP